MREIAPAANSTPGYQVQQQAAGMLTGVLISGRAPAAGLCSAAVALSGWWVHAPGRWDCCNGGQRRWPAALGPGSAGTMTL